MYWLALLDVQRCVSFFSFVPNISWSTAYFQSRTSHRAMKLAV